MHDIWMIKLSMSCGRWNNLKNILDSSKSNITNSCIVDSTLWLKNCINDSYSQICCEEVSQIQKTGLEWIIYARYLKDVTLNGLPYWLTGIFVFLELL